MVRHNASNSALDLVLGTLLVLFCGVLSGLAIFVAFVIGWFLGRPLYWLLERGREWLA